MGMYDTLNGEQVKCFPWFSFYVSAMDTKGVVTSHGGDLKYYGNGSEIPYRSLAYNYGKNFIIFDFTPELGTDEIGEWVAHVIENGRLKASFYRKDADDEFEKMLKKSTKNIGYYGDDNFKFKTLEDVNQYAKEANALRCQITDMYKPANAIMREWSKTFHESKNLEKGSEEYAVFQKKVQDFIKRHDEELAKIKPIISKLNKDFADKWIEKDSAEYIRMSDFGESVEAGILTLKCRKNRKKNQQKRLKKPKNTTSFLTVKRNGSFTASTSKKHTEKCLKKKERSFGRSILSGARLLMRRERRLRS